MQFLEELNTVQRDAVKAANGPVMIIAGAGSGKTRVLTYRIAYLVECGVPAYQILALTFTNKAANEMKGRVVKLVGDKARQVWMGTFHSMFARVLRKESQHLGYSQAFTIYDADDSLSVIKRTMERLNIPTQQFNPQAVRSRISGAKNQMITPDAYAEMARDIFDDKASQVFREYQKTLASSNAMDFDDLLVKPIDLFQRHPKILEKYQQQFRFILVDEFQDTNRAQYHVTKQLAGTLKNICVVGDDAQSIYSFRGADIRNILDFEKDFPECQTFRLEQNYRSTKSIINTADQLIRNNQHQLKKHLWTENPEGDAVTALECSDDQDEGYQIVRLIHENSLQDKLDLKDFAVLYRTNAQSRSLEDALRRSGIPYVIVGGIRFYERKEIKDVLGYFRLLTNPRDDESFLRVVNYPARGIGDVSIEVIRGVARKHQEPLLDAVRKSDELGGLNERARKGLAQVAGLVDKYRELRSKMSLSEWSRSLVDELGILRMFKEEGTTESLARWENIQELLSAITEFSDKRESATLEGFLEEVTLVSDIDQWDGTRNAVTLMTLHASKGLEFPVVFIAGLEEGLLPFYTSSIDQPDLEEERRLLYVGITRSEKKLYLTHTNLRYRFGDATFPSESRFLSELGSKNLERIRHRSPHRPSGVADHAPARRTRVPQRTPAVDEDFVPDKLPDYESESQEEFVVKRGSVVEHEIFGRGKVLEVSGKGRNLKAVVQFESYGRKSLLLEFARLRPA